MLIASKPVFELQATVDPLLPTIFESHPFVQASWEQQLFREEAR